MKKLNILTLFLVLGAISLATNWAPTTASVKFYIKNAGITVDGSLSGLAASVNFNPTDLANSKITASVKVNTIKTGIDARDTHLKSEDYFSASQYPRIEMESTSFTKGSGNNFTGKFNLTIRGITKSISIPFTFVEANGKGTFKGGFTIDRLDYGVGESSFVLSDDVKIKLTLNSTKK